MDCGKASQPHCDVILHSLPSLITSRHGIVSILTGKACIQLGSLAGLFVSDPHARELVHGGKHLLQGCLYPTLMLAKSLHAHEGMSVLQACLYQTLMLGRTPCMHEGMSVLQDERARVKEQQDGAYHRLQALKQQSKGKKDAYYQNRRFSQEVLHSWHAHLTVLYGRAGVDICIPSEGSLATTSFVFVSVPPGPYPVGCLCPDSSSFCSLF